MSENTFGKYEETRQIKRRLLPKELGAYLEFVGGEENGRQVMLVFERTILGRKAGDILVRDIRVSSQHLAIEFQGEGFRVIDLGSTNGTFLEGKKIKEAFLQENQVVQLGGSSFRICVNPEKAKKIKPPRTVETGSLMGGLSGLIEREFIQATSETGTIRVSGSNRVPTFGVIHLQVVEGPDKGKTFSISKAQIFIGRSGSDINLKDMDVSRKHALMEQMESGQVILRDLASANGTMVNGQPVANCVLQPEDQIQIGGTILHFQGVLSK